MAEEMKLLALCLLTLTLSSCLVAKVVINVPGGYYVTTLTVME